jgi:hypothetical protein
MVFDGFDYFLLVGGVLCIEVVARAEEQKDNSASKTNSTLIISSKKSSLF